ncbi:MAG: methylated-DNA--[protein]-cysteine S-methyltransferase [Acetobacteraceae bacterium]|nr:methylated-DNA--[protein]-cysteine S-methyltransferase [Acetobacteraceae bacterium]
MPQLSLHSPLGDLTISEEDGVIVAVDWGWGRDQEPTPLLGEARAQLHAYFDRRLIRFDLPMAPAGTPYRQRVWAALREIPAGQVRTYADIAAVAGGAARSVGQANGANPIPVLIPCHRVVAVAGANGRWTSAGIGGYSAGDGATTKRFLLQLEARAA